MIKTRHIISMILIIAIFSMASCSRDSDKDPSLEKAEENALRCYEIAMMNKASESIGYEDKPILDGCIILPVSGKYWTFEKYGGAKKIREVYWFYSRNDWLITDEGKISNFEQITENNDIYGVYTVE